VTIMNDSKLRFVVVLPSTENPNGQCRVYFNGEHVATVGSAIVDLPTFDAMGDPNHGIKLGVQALYHGIDVDEAA